jgi:hypothetical protein
LDVVMLHRGEIPSLLMIFCWSWAVPWMCETEAHPWLIDEKRAIREWAINNRPAGICLGLQLWRG